jgi:hypothetical protein
METEGDPPNPRMHAGYWAKIKQAKGFKKPLTKRQEHHPIKTTTATPYQSRPPFITGDAVQGTTGIIFLLQSFPFFF